jgi:peptidoglycan/xylan/chitin deacetylase (PgdA/CDA1 family)
VSRVVCVTFDNLGPADDPERGRWRDTLPRILERLDAERVRATFFVEGVNAELHPDILRELAEAGHEVALHGWEHEPWGGLDAARERALLERGVRALDALGLRPAGFRPPGGALTGASAALLRELGFSYCSPQAGEAAPGVAVLPFRWALVDALYVLPRFAGRRERELGSPEAQPPERLCAALAAALAADDLVVPVFHAFLADTDQRFAVIARALERVRALADEGALRCAPCRDVAAAR